MSLDAAFESPGLPISIRMGAITFGDLHGLARGRSD